MHDYDFVEENLALAYYTYTWMWVRAQSSSLIVYTVGCGGCVSMGARGGIAPMTSVEEHVL